MKLEDAYFGIMVPDLTTGGLVQANLFGSERVKKSVAIYRTLKEFDFEKTNHLFFCFGDTCGKVQYEWMVSPFTSKGKIGKVDVFQMYVVPNEMLLMDIVNKISVNSCKKWLRENNKKYRIVRLNNETTK